MKYYLEWHIDNVFFAIVSNNNRTEFSRSTIYKLKKYMVLNAPKNSKFIIKSI